MGKWQSVTLGKIISPAKIVKCGPNSYPVFSMTMRDGIVLQSERFKKSLASLDTSEYKVVSKGQLVVGFPIDEGVLYIQQYDFNGIMSPAYDVWNVDYSMISCDYLEYALHSPQSMHYYASKLRGTTARRRSITKEDLLALSFPLPPLETQRQITATLDSVTRVIELCNEILEKFDLLVKARFVEMFGKGNYPQAAISDLVTGKVPSVKKDFTPDDTIKYIDISSIDKRRNVMTGFTEYILSEAPSRAQQHIVQGDILVSTVRPNLRNVALVTFPDDNLVASSGFCVLRAKKCLPSYLLAVVCSDEFTDAMSKVVTGANYPAIKDSDVMTYTVSVPPMDKQREFDSFTTQTNQSKSPVKKMLAQAETLKKTLMQEYFGQ